jgi:hypothetical protein
MSQVMNLINFIFNNSTYLAVVVVPGRIFVDLGFLPVVTVAVGRAAIPVPPTKFHCGTISGGPWLRIGSKVFGIKVFEVVALCDSEFASSLVSASVTIDRCSESLIGVLVMLSTDARGMVSLMTDIGGAGAAAGETLPALPVESSDVVATETSMFNLSETELGSISLLCTYIECSVMSLIKLIYMY